MEKIKRTGGGTGGGTGRMKAWDRLKERRRVTRRRGWPATCNSVWWVSLCLAVRSRTQILSDFGCSQTLNAPRFWMLSDFGCCSSKKIYFVYLSGRCTSNELTHRTVRRTLSRRSFNGRASPKWGGLFWFRILSFCLKSPGVLKSKGSETDS